MDATTNYHQFDGLKQHDCILSQFWRPKSKVKFTARAHSLWKLYGRILLALSSLLWLSESLASLTCGHITLIFVPSSHCLFLFCLSNLPCVSVIKYTYIHISVQIGIPRKTTTLRSGPKKKRGEGVGLINEAANALLRLVSVQLPRHMSSRKEYLCFTLMYPVFI